MHPGKYKKEYVMNIKSKARMSIMLNLGVKLLQHSEE